MKSILLGFSMRKSNQLESSQLICYGENDPAKQSGRFKSDAQIAKAKESNAQSQKESADRIASQLSANREARDAQVAAVLDVGGKALGVAGRLAGRVAKATGKAAVSLGKAAIKTVGNEVTKEVARRSSPSAAEKKAKQAEINRAMR